jgi:hypothetical protein
MSVLCFCRLCARQVGGAARRAPHAREQAAGARPAGRLAWRHAGPAMAAPQDGQAALPPGSVLVAPWRYTATGMAGFFGWRNEASRTCRSRSLGGRCYVALCSRKHPGPSRRRHPGAGKHHGRPAARHARGLSRHRVRRDAGARWRAGRDARSLPGPHRSRFRPRVRLRRAGAGRRWTPAAGSAPPTRASRCRCSSSSRSSARRTACG